jgi:hypothetical protein
MPNEGRTGGAGPGDFGSPPHGGAAGDAQEEPGQKFRSPDESETQAEAAALASVSSELLEAKGAVEDALRQQGEQRAGIQSLDSASDVGMIQGVAIGIGDGAGPAGSGLTGVPGEPLLTIYLAEPRPPEQVQSLVVEGLGVAEAAADEVPLNAVVTGIIDASPHRFRARRAPGGISVAHHAVTAGTLGCLATGRAAPRDEQLMILSNNHVLANANDAQVGDCICQPGPYDGGKCPADKVAVLEKFVPIEFGGAVNYVDCATAWAWPDRVTRELGYMSGGQLVPFRVGEQVVAPQLGLAVGKSGRTTQVTSGRITGIGASLWVNYSGGRSAFFQDQISIQGFSANFSAGGDSGSLIWTWSANRNPVALLYAGGGGVTFANPLDRVLTELDISLYT